MDIQNAQAGLIEFLEAGGGVLTMIMVSAFVMWAFIMERVAYWLTAHRGVVDKTVKKWESLPNQSSPEALAVRDKLISEARQRAEQNVELVKTLVALAPLLGLLGTVWGMIQVFDVLALSDQGGARAMAAGVYRAILPTMAGLATAITGLPFSYRFERAAKTQMVVLSEKLQVR